MNIGILNPPLENSQQMRGSTQRRRREILDAALACFLQNGVAQTTLEQIRTASKASNGSIYHLFRGKDELVLTLFIEGMRIYLQKIMQALEPETTARGCIRAMIVTHLQDVVDDPPLAIYLTRLSIVSDLEEISQQHQSFSEEFIQVIWARLEPFVEQGQIVRLPPKLYFSLIIGPASHLARSWLRERMDFDLMSAADHLVEAAWNSLRLS